ncbi:hypothetical protein C817_01972 [Dorea sp. 5-2]|nr:hypothetical protein C817_01972 [Dorea sp. 5-2]
MTSRISFNSLRRENMRHRTGVILLAAFSFLVYLIWYLISAQKLSRGSHYDSDVRKIWLALSGPGVQAGRAVIAAAVLLAVSGFRYLHSKKEVDLYHSLPLKRRSHLYIIVSSDFMIFTALLILFLCLQSAIAAVAGYFSRELFADTLWSFVCYLAVFAATYLTMALAMILTGQTFVGMMVFGVIVTYAPLILQNLYTILAEVFFKTYYADIKKGMFLTYCSPIGLARKLLNDIFETDAVLWTWEARSTAFAASCIWITVTGAAVFVLFHKRPSETAGNAMAFPKANGIIRILLVIPVSVYAGLLLYMASSCSVQGWLVVGVVAGGVLTHGALESIYRLDIRGFFAYKKQMLFSIAAASGIIGVFWADVAGYDTYLPKKEETASILLEDGFAYRSDGEGEERNGISGAVKDDVLDVLADIIAENDQSYEIYYGDGDSSGYYSYVVHYRLENGREKIRSYMVGFELYDRLMEQVFESKEYREDQFVIYSGDRFRVQDIGFTNIMGSVSIKTTEEQREEMLRIYLEDFDKLDYDTARTEIPWGKFDIDCSEREKDGADHVFRSVSCDGSWEEYYIYPSFQNTIKYMENWLNEKFPLSFEEIPVTEICIRDYIDGAGEEYMITDEEFIRSVKEKFCATDVGSDFYPRDTSLNISLTVDRGNGTEFVSVYTDPETAWKIREYLK